MGELEYESGGILGQVAPANPLLGSRHPLWVQTFQCGCSGDTTVLSVTPQPCFVSKLSGSPGRTSVKSNFCLSLGLDERVDVVSPFLRGEGKTVSQHPVSLLLCLTMLKKQNKTNRPKLKSFCSCEGLSQ